MNRSEKLGLLACVLALGLSGAQCYTQIKLNKAEALVDQMRANAPKLVKTAAQIGFMGGCIDVLVEVGRTAPQDPLFPIYQQQCMQFGAHFAEGVKLQIEDEKDGK